MKQRVTILVIGCMMICISAQAQSDVLPRYKNFPLIVSIQFHAFSLPFRDFRSNFKNIGIGLGTEVSLNGSNDWVQQLNVVWYHNRKIGNGVSLYSQLVWRPEIVDRFFTGVKLGIGGLYSFRPEESFKQTNGKWISSGHKGKMMFVIPTGLSVGYNSNAAGTQISPFVGYQFMLVNGYNRSIPLVPETLLQAGTRIHF